MLFAVWEHILPILDDYELTRSLLFRRFDCAGPGTIKNIRGRIAFAHAGPDTRTTQLFLNTADNSRLVARPIPDY